MKKYINIYNKSIYILNIYIFSKDIRVSYILSTKYFIKIH